MPPLIKRNKQLDTIPVARQPKSKIDENYGSTSSAFSTFIRKTASLCHEVSIRGFRRGYLAKQLEDFRSGKRANAVMQPIALALKNTEGEAVARYLNALVVDAPSVGLNSTGSLGSVAEKLVKQGDWSRNIPACVACHGVSNTGVGESFPPLVGQSSAYIAAQLNAWRSGTRANDPNELMSHIARSLSDTEIQDLSVYLPRLSGEVKQ